MKGTRAISYLLVTVMGAVASVSAQCTGHTYMNAHERSEFIAAAYGKRTEIAIQLLAAEGCTQTMLDSVSRAGARIRFADNKVGYALVLIPKDKVLDLLDVRGAAYASATTQYYPIYFSDPKLANGLPGKAAPVPPITIPFPRVATKLPKDGPYFPAEEAGLTALWAAHPAADGRGVRVAVIDQGLDLLHPALLEAIDPNGNRVPKIVDVDVSTKAGEDRGWVQFGEPFETRDGSFEAAGRAWIAPHEGRYRFGIFARPIQLGGPLVVAPAIVLPESVKTMSVSVGVLWDEDANRVWVDTDGDGSFKNQRALGDYGETHDIDSFGRKEGEEDNRIPFGVRIDKARRTAYLSIADGPHGGLIAGTLAANRLTGGLFDGAGPNAQLIDVRPMHIARMVSLLRAFARNDVDVINLSGGIARNIDMEEFQRYVLTRAVAVYNKPLLCFCHLPGALHVADYQSPEMLRRNRQVSPPYVESVNSSIQFMTDGLVNEILAPSVSIVTESRYMPADLPGKDAKRYISPTLTSPPAPAGYGIGANNSPTIPVVAGIVADIISEARRVHLRYDARRLISAVSIGTRWLPGFAAARQGFGLVDAEQAWNQFAKMATVDDPKNPELTSFSVSRMVDGKRTDVRGFHADLAHADISLNDEIWITRHGGYSGERKYTFSIRGDDDTYRLLDQEASIAKDQPVRVRFSVHVTPGLHVAFLQLRDTAAGVVMGQVPLAVKAPEGLGLESVAAGVERYQATLPPRSTQNVYVAMDREVQAARYLMRIPYLGPPMISFRALPGFTWGIEGNAYVQNGAPDGEPVDAKHHVGPMQVIESLAANLTPGTQNIYWGNRGQAEYEVPEHVPPPNVPITASLTVTKYAVDIAKLGADRVRLTNKMADIDGSVEFYDAKVSQAEVAGSGPYSFVELRRDVPAQLVQLRLSAMGSASADLFLLDCTTEKDICTVHAHQTFGPEAGSIVVDDPRPGAWRVVVRTREASASPATFRLRVAGLAAGQVGNVEKHQSGTTWMVPLRSKNSDAPYVAFKIAGSPGDPRQKSKTALNGLRIAMTALDADAP